MMRIRQHLAATAWCALSVLAVFGGVANAVLEPVVLINCGSYANHTDPIMGFQWEADQLHTYYDTSGTLGLSLESPSEEFAETENDVVYATYRLFKARKDPPYRYRIPVPNGSYVVELHFAETEFTTAGARIMNIRIQDNLEHTGVDVFALGGNAINTAVTLETVATVDDGFIMIDLESVKKNPFISAIAIYEEGAPSGEGSLPSAAPTSVPSVSPSAEPSKSPSGDSSGTPQFEAVALINCGGGDYTDNNGMAWEADSTRALYAAGGTNGISQMTTTEIFGTDDDVLFQSGRMFKRRKPEPYKYEIPVPAAGDYNVILHFAEIDPNRAAVGRRRFDVFVEDELLVSRFDIVQAAGGAGFTAVSLATTVTVADSGPLTILLQKRKSNPFISAISVHRIVNPGGSIPSQEPSPAPSGIPSKEPVSVPSQEPSSQSSSIPSKEPSSAPSAAPTTAKSRSPSLVPTATDETSTRPSVFPTANLPPTLTISESPSMSRVPTLSETSSASPSQVPSTTPLFQPVLINVGGQPYEDVRGRTFDSDAFFSGGETYSLVSDIDGTADDTMYQSQRYGPSFFYDIPLPEGNYEIILHFAVLEETANNTHVFDISVEGNPAFSGVEISALVGTFYAMTLETVSVITDGFLTLQFAAETGDAIVSAIELNIVGPHLAHSVASGPYTGVDYDGTGFALVPVNGGASHTHAPGRILNSWWWYEGTTLVASGEITVLLLPVGEHFITLRVMDDGGNASAETTIVTVLPQGYPVVQSLTPSQGDLSGGNSVTISGFGFDYLANETVVHFGYFDLSGSEITVVNPSTIVVLSVPAQSLGIPVSVTVSTPLGLPSNAATYTYTNGQIIDWTRGNLLDTYGPTALEWGPDRKLYIGTIDGKLMKLTLNDDNDAILESLISSVVADSDPTCPTEDCRSILGMTFDPMDAGLPNPPVYLSHSQTFHGDSILSSSGGAINGKVSIVSGANLDSITDLITGLPVSDHDHAINGLEFDDHGDLYFLVGGNTNAGVKGALSGSQLLKDNVLSAAMLVAHVSDPGFDGVLTYDAEDDGNLVGGVGSVEVFASGLRSAYDFIFHSNGRLYATDNGPNLTYGDTSTSCTTSIPDVQEQDKLNLIVQGGYYGHANRKRGENDSRQCVWRSAHEASDADYTAPLTLLPASSNGIVEFQGSHFGGQLRGNLVIAKYKGELYRAVLTPDGSAVVPETNPPVVMHSDSGLDLTQGPDGKLYFVRYKAGKVRFLGPNEDASPIMVVKSVFPRRGSQAGGSILSVYGEHFIGSGMTTVSVGGTPCVPVLSVSSTMITCVLPGGSPGTVADILVTNGSEAATFTAGYRYISGGV